MATTNSINLKTKTARKKLPPYREPYFVKFPTEVLKGGSLGFRRSPDSQIETWHGRVYLDGGYIKETLGEVTAQFEYKEAYKAALDWAQKIKDAGPVAAKDYTLEEVLDEYLKKLQGNSKPRLLVKRREAAKRLDALLTPALKRRKVNDLTKTHINDLQLDYSMRRNEKKKKELCPETGEMLHPLISPVSVNRVFTHLIAALNHGYKNDRIATKQAWKHYERLKADGTTKDKEYIPKEERQDYLNACPAELKAICTAMNLMATRPSELRRLRVAAVDLKGKKVQLKTYKGPKGAKERNFPLPEGTAIRALFEAQIKDKEPDQLVFTTSGGIPWTQPNLAKHHNLVRDNGKFSPAFCSYIWRHCRITDLAGEFPAPEVANLVGTSLQYLQENYYHENEDIRSAMAGML